MDCKIIRSPILVQNNGYCYNTDIPTVEYLSMHYENWAKAGSGAGYSIKDSDKLNYISNFNWIENWMDRYFFNKVSDFLYSLIFMITIFIVLFKSSKSLKIFERNYKLLLALLFLIFIIWFLFHPTLRYGGYHLFFLTIFIPLSFFLEKFSKDIKNLDRKILVLVIITAFVFTGRNLNRLIKEYKINSYNPFINISYPLREESFRIQKRIEKMINEKKAKKIYKNRYIVF